MDEKEKNDTDIVIFLSVNRALWGAIYPEVRAVTFGYSKENKILTLRYYLDRKPTETDLDIVSSAAGEILADLYDDVVIDVKEECIYLPLNQEVVCLDQWMYQRRENF